MHTDPKFSTPPVRQHSIRAHRTPQRAAWLLPLLLAVGGCQTAPGLPTVDDSQRRPINNAVAIELQACKAEATALRATLAEAAAPHCAASSPRLETPAKALPPPAQTSRLAVFVFEPNQVTLSPDEATRRELADAAGPAERVHVRSTSGSMRDRPTDAQAARKRAEAVAALLKDLGIPAEKLRVTWQGSADASSEPGQARRVEIEFVEKAPQLLFTRAAAEKAAPTSPTASPATSPASAATPPAANGPEPAPDSKTARATPQS